MFFFNVNVVKCSVLKGSIVLKFYGIEDGVGFLYVWVIWFLGWGIIEYVIVDNINIIDVVILCYVI